MPCTIAQAAHQRHHAVDVGMVHAGHRFVQQQQPRLRCQAHRDLQHPLVAVRQAAGDVVLAPAEADEADDLMRALAPARRCAGATPAVSSSPAQKPELRVHVQPDQHVAQHGESRGTAATCWNVRTRPRRTRSCIGTPVMSAPSKRTRPAVGGSVPVIRLNSVVLPAPFGPIRPRISPGLDRQRDVVDGDQPAEPARQAGDLEERHAQPRRSDGRRSAAVAVDQRADAAQAPMMPCGISQHRERPGSGRRRAI